MSQLTSIEQCKVGDIVYHPIWKEGKIKRKDKNSFSIFVEFSEIWHKAFWFYEEEKAIYAEVRYINQLYTDPVKIITTDRLELMIGIIEYFATNDDLFDDQIGRDMISTALQILIDIKLEKK